MDNIRYPESDAEAIDAALAKHDDRKAALQVKSALQVKENEKNPVI